MKKRPPRGRLALTLGNGCFRNPRLAVSVELTLGSLECTVSRVRSRVKQKNPGPKTGVLSIACARGDLNPHALSDTGT